MACRISWEHAGGMCEPSNHLSSSGPFLAELPFLQGLCRAVRHVRGPFLLIHSLMGVFPYSSFIYSSHKHLPMLLHQDVELDAWGRQGDSKAHSFSGGHSHKVSFQLSANPDQGLLVERGGHCLLHGGSRQNPLSLGLQHALQTSPRTFPDTPVELAAPFWAPVGLVHLTVNTRC